MYIGHNIVQEIVSYQFPDKKNASQVVEVIYMVKRFLFSFLLSRKLRISLMAFMWCVKHNILDILKDQVLIFMSSSVKHKRFKWKYPLDMSVSFKFKNMYLPF